MESNELKVVNFSEALSAFKKMLKDTYRISKKPEVDHYDYQGPEIEHFSVLATMYNIHDSLSKEELEYRAQKNSTTVSEEMLDNILGGLFRLGFSSAMIKCDQSNGSDMVEKLLKMLETDPGFNKLKMAIKCLREVRDNITTNEETRITISQTLNDIQNYENS